MTINQTTLLRFVNQYREKHGFSPSYREIQREISVSSIRSVYIIVKALVLKGYLAKDESNFRSLNLTTKGMDFLGLNTMKIEYNPRSFQYRLPFIQNGSSYFTGQKGEIATMFEKTSTIKNNSTHSSNKTSRHNYFLKEDPRHSTISKRETSFQGNSLIQLKNVAINLSPKFTETSSLFITANKNESISTIFTVFVLAKLFDDSIWWFLLLLGSIFLAKIIYKFLRK